MTNEEKLREVFPKTIFIYRKEDDKTVAIQCSNEWLNAEYKEPTTKNNLGVDCISREQALVAIRNLYPGMPRVDFNGSLRKWVDRYKPYIECDDAIEQLPPVTPIRPKWHWIVAKGGSYLGSRNACCSNCKDFYTNDWNVMNFCPNCGSDNREVKE